MNMAPLLPEADGYCVSPQPPVMMDLFLSYSNATSTVFGSFSRACFLRYLAACPAKRWVLVVSNSASEIICS